jgi:hypothetical protein
MIENGLHSIFVELIGSDTHSSDGRGLDFLVRVMENLSFFD